MIASKYGIIHINLLSLQSYSTTTLLIYENQHFTKQINFLRDHLASFSAQSTRIEISQTMNQDRLKTDQKITIAMAIKIQGQTL